MKYIHRIHSMKMFDKTVGKETFMGQTIIEKILSKNLGRAVRAGDEALFEPDLTVAYDYPGYIDSYEKQMDELGVTSVAHPDKFLFFIDHFNPAGDSKSREVHVKTRSFAKRMGIQLWEDVGIGHQVIMEKGYVVPGTMLIHFDGHVSTLGSVGAGAISVRNAVIEALATGKVSIVVPGTLRVNFIGKLEKGVTARDVFHTLVQRLGPSGACSLCLEFGGEGLKNLTMDDRIMAEFGRIDILMNNAGAAITKKAEDLTMEEWDRVVNVDLRGAFMVAQAVGKVMIRQNYGRIINTISVYGYVGGKLVLPYLAAKGGLAQVTKGLAMEWARYNINVNALVPGYIVTEINKKEFENEKVYNSIVRKIPMRRLGSVEDVIGSVIFLASDASNYVTGAVIAADGGWLCE